MTQIESKTVKVNKSANELHELLSNYENFSKFMPDSVTSFEADDTSFKFGLKGMPEVRLVQDETDPPSLIRLKSASSKIDFSLAAHINALTEDSSELKFDFSGKFNPMLKMMVERPLKAFIEELADRVSAV